MQIYIGTKKVRAAPMTRAGYNRYRGWELPVDENGDDPGYLVEYLDGGQKNHPDHDGYISWSPDAVFKNAYRAIDGGLTFGDALTLLKAGEQVTRAGWNGKGMWLSLTVPAPGTVMVEGFGRSDSQNKPDLRELPLLPWIGMKTADGKYVPWLASQTDMLAEDWGLYLLP
jgi:hypothetical protein